MQFNFCHGFSTLKTDQWVRMNAYPKMRINIERIAVSSAPRCGYLRLHKIGRAESVARRPPSSMSELLQELICGIIDQIDDRISLGACPLVSSRWSPRSSSIQLYRRIVSRIHYPRHPGLTHRCSFPFPVLVRVPGPGGSEMVHAYHLRGFDASFLWLFPRECDMLDTERCRCPAHTRFKPQDALWPLSTSR